MASGDSASGFEVGFADVVSQNRAMPAVWATVMPESRRAAMRGPLRRPAQNRVQVTILVHSAHPPLQGFPADNIVVMEDAEIFGAIGEEGFQRLVAAFYRQVPADDILGPMYPPEDLDGAEQRLRDFLVGRFGGPSRYMEQRGHPRLRMRHAPFSINSAARDRWIALMFRALDEARLPPDVDRELRSFFEDVATMMMNTRG
jgi:hemoglobin